MPRKVILPEQPKKFLNQVRDALRIGHCSDRTEQSYVDWIKRYILFHQKRHPKDMGGLEIQAFLAFLKSTAIKPHPARHNQKSCSHFVPEQCITIELFYLTAICKYRQFPPGVLLKLIHE